MIFIKKETTLLWLLPGIEIIAVMLGESKKRI